MKQNGNHRTRNYDAEIAFGQETWTFPPTTRSGLLDWIRAHGARLGRRKKGRPARTFWMLDPITGEWRLL